MNTLLCRVMVCGLFLSASIICSRSQPYTWATIAALSGTTTSSNSTIRPGVAMDSQGNLYVADPDTKTIRQIRFAGSNWVVTTLAGLAGSSGTANGTNSTARFTRPSGITVDSAGDLFVTDSFPINTIRRVSRSGTNWVVTTLAGSPWADGKADGTNSGARFSSPMGITVDGAGTLYVADMSNQIIRKIVPMGTNWVVTTIAGSGYLGHIDGTNRATSFFAPYGICVDGTGNLYVTDQGNELIRKITPAGTNWVVSTIAGTAGTSGGTDGTNASALFNNPCYLTVDNGANLFVADNWNNSIRRISPAGTNWIVVTIGGSTNSSGKCDGVGSDALFNGPAAVAVDSTGSLYVTDFLNRTIRKGVPFVVTSFLQNEAVPIGTSVNLHVAAASDSSLSYQWFFRGALLPDETTSTLALGPMGRANTGIYSTVVSNGDGNWISLSATVRALVPPMIELPELLSNGGIHLAFKDADGGLPYDVTQVQLQWRTELPSGEDTDWLILPATCYLTNGFAAFDDTNVLSGSGRFYRILER